MARPRSERRASRFGQRAQALLLALFACVLLAGCGAARTRPAVTTLELNENGSKRQVDDGAVLDGLATSDEYDRNVLGRDLDRVERYYRARGYYEAKVTAARVVEPREPGVKESDRHVRIELRVTPGKAVIVRNVERQGAVGVSTRVIHELDLARDRLAPGALFDEAKFDEMKAATLDALRDNGYPYAKVDAKAHVDLLAHTADIMVSLEPGLRATYGEVKIVGLKSIPEGPVRDNLEVEIRTGQRYSHSDLQDARQALLNLGVFSSVDVHDDLSDPTRKQVPVQVIVHETSLRALRLGGGIDFDVLRLNGHLRVGWEHQNFLGGMRDLQISATPGLDFYPTRLATGAPFKPSKVLPENSIQVRFMQPAFIEGRTTGTIEANYDIKPLLYPVTFGDTVGSRPQDQPIVGYQSLTTDAGLKRDFPLRFSRRVRGNLEVALAYNWQANFPFMYQLGLPDGLGNVRVAFPSLNTTFDLVDDRANPREGIRLLNKIELAEKIFGGSVSDFKIQPDFRAYVPLDTIKSVVLALRASVGFLFPRDYGNTLTGSSSGVATDPSVVFDQEKLLMRAFYSGGPNSNRGYPLRGVGPHGVVGFLIPSGQNCPANVDPNNLPATCLRPTGGFTVWEASIELRFPISGPINMVTFADASDVTRDVGRIRFNVPHISVGPGLRYMTPVGPVRLDVGYRVPGLQELGHTDLLKNEGQGNLPTIFGAPVTLNIALQEAF